MPRSSIDLQKVRVELLRLDRNALLDLVDRALKLVPLSKVPELLKGHIKLEDVAPSPSSKASVVAQVKSFHEAATARNYYEGFNVNSKNYREKSPGTGRFMAEFDRLEKLCIQRESKTPPEEMREALELLFDLLQQIDRGRPIIFLASDAGSWQVRADYDSLMPLYFRTLSKTADAAVYAEAVTSVIEKFDPANRKEHVEAAKLAATEEQRAALQGKGRAAPKKTGAAKAKPKGR